MILLCFAYLVVAWLVWWFTTLVDDDPPPVDPESASQP